MTSPSEPKFSVGDEALYNGVLVTIIETDWLERYQRFIYLAADPDGDETWFEPWELNKNPFADRVTFEGGGMRDSQEGKPRFDLLVPLGIPFDKQYLTRVARLMARGADHYEDRNWERFDDQEALDRAKASAFRHFMQWLTGEDDEDHAASIFFNVMAVEYIKEKMSG